MRTPPSASNCNASLNRFNGSFKREVVDRLAIFGEAHLRRVIDEYITDYHRERNHQGLEGCIIEAGEDVGLASEKIYRRQRLGGIFNYPYRNAAEYVA